MRAIVFPPVGRQWTTSRSYLRESAYVKYYLPVPIFFFYARKAITLLEQALQKDPTFTQAYLEMASAWRAFGYSVPGGLSPKDHMPKAKAAALKAVELDPTLATGHLHLASIYYNYEYAWDKADQSYQTALQLAPDNAPYHAFYGWFLGSMGRFEDALAAVQKAHQLDPSLLWNDVTYLLIHYWMRDYDTAAKYGQLAQQHEGNTFVPFFTGFVAAAQQRYDKAIADLEQSLSFVKNGGGLATLAYMYAQAGQKAKAQEILTELETGPRQMIPPYRIAAVYLALGQRDTAIEWLQRSHEERGNWLVYLKVDPVMDPLRSEPHFQDLLRRMNFPE